MGFNIFKKEKLPGDLKRFMSPRRKFLSETKGRFLAAYDVRYRHAAKASGRLSFVYRIGVSFVAVMAIATAGASVYADSKNVPADSPLYPLKRLSENVQMVLANPQDRPQLQAKLAARRSQEIAKLEENDNAGFDALANAPESASSSNTEATSAASNSASMENKGRKELISSLAKDLRKEIDSSINGAENEDLTDGKLADFCSTLGSAIYSSSVVSREGSRAHAGFLQRFEEKCGQSGGDQTASTTLNASASSGIPEFIPDRGGRSARGGDGNGNGESGGNTNDGFRTDINSQGSLFGGPVPAVTTSTNDIVSSTLKADVGGHWDGGND